MRDVLIGAAVLLGTLPAAGGSETPVALPTASAFLWASLGILISIVLPILRASLPKPPVASAPALPGTPRTPWFLVVARPYVIVGAFSFLTAILIVALAGETLKSWNMAILAGYAWDSTLQKLAKA